MRKKSSLKKKLIISVTVMMLLVAMVVVTALAEADTGVVITGGAFSGGDMTFTDFGGVTGVALNGTAQTIDATWSIGDIIDARGTGDGWRLNLTFSFLREYDTSLGVYVDPGKMIAPNSITVLTAPVITDADPGGTSSPVSTITTVSAGTAIDNIMGNTTLFSAVEGGGMGSYTVDDMVVRLTLRADAYAGTFRADAIVALVSGP